MDARGLSNKLKLIFSYIFILFMLKCHFLKAKTEAKMKKTRLEALAAREKFFYTGKACKNGHLSKRATKTGVCCQCNIEYQKKYKEKFEGIDWIVPADAETGA